MLNNISELLGIECYQAQNLVGQYRHLRDVFFFFVMQILVKDRYKNNYLSKILFKKCTIITVMEQLV